MKSNALDCYVKSYKSPAQKNPQSSSIERLNQNIDRLAQANKRHGEGLIFDITLRSAHIWSIKLNVNC